MTTGATPSPFANLNGDLNLRRIVWDTFQAANVSVDYADKHAGGKA